MPRNRVVTACVMIVTFAFCYLVICVASAQNKTDTKEPGRQVDEAYQMIYDATKKQRDAYQRHLDDDVDRGRRVDALLTRWEEQTAKQEKVAERYLKILDTWEKQQQQMQKLLDAMAKK